MVQHTGMFFTDQANLLPKPTCAVGWVVPGKTVLSRKGDPMKSVSIEDTTGLYESIIFPKVYDQCCHMLNTSRPYILKGKVEEDFTALTLTIHQIGFLDWHNQKNATSQQK